MTDQQHDPDPWKRFAAQLERVGRVLRELVDSPDPARPRMRYRARRRHLGYTRTGNRR